MLFYNYTMKKIETIALIAPSGDIRNISEINKKIEILEKKFKIKKYYNENAACNYLSDSDENRVKFFEAAFCDNEVDLVVSLRGGFGAIRIVDKINFKKFENSNKFYLGSSDASIFLAALNKFTNVQCFHGLMVSNGFVENLDRNIEIIENNIFNINLTSINHKQARGKLWGGNLSSIVSILSNDELICDDDIILFLEDLNEPLYKVDKMLFEIYRNKKLKEKIKGIIFGDFYIEDKALDDLLLDYSKKFCCACFRCLDITHKTNNITLPYGKTVELRGIL